MKLKLKKLMMVLSISACTLGFSATSFAQVNTVLPVSSISINAEGVAIDSEGYDKSFDEEFARLSRGRSGVEGYLSVNSYFWKTSAGPSDGEQNYHMIISAGAQVIVLDSSGQGSYAKVQYNNKIGYVHKDNICLS